MLGPNDLVDWDFDERDQISLELRRHPVIQDIARNSGARTMFDRSIAALARRFARQEMLPIEDLRRLKDSLPR